MRRISDLPEKLAELLEKHGGELIIEHDWSYYGYDTHDVLIVPHTDHENVRTWVFENRHFDLGYRPLIDVWGGEAFGHEIDFQDSDHEFWSDGETFWAECDFIARNGDIFSKRVPLKIIWVVHLFEDGYLIKVHFLITPKTLRKALERGLEYVKWHYKRAWNIINSPIVYDEYVE